MTTDIKTQLKVSIRPATVDDLEAINEIYNEAVLRTTGTFDLEPKSLEDRRVWFDQHAADHPVLVAEHNGAIVGWASLNRYDPKKAYAQTADVSIYIAEKSRGLGVGRQLLPALVHAGEATNLRTALARITYDNLVSIRLHEQNGFQKVGVMREVGTKFGRLLDVCILQRMLR